MSSRDAFKVLKLYWPAAHATLTTLKTSLVPIYHKMHLRSYDFPTLSETKILIGHYNHSISVDAKIVESKHCPIIGEHVAVNFVTQ